MAYENDRLLHRSQLFFYLMLPLFIWRILFVWHCGAMDFVLWAKGMLKARGQLLVSFIRALSGTVNKQHVLLHAHFPLYYLATRNPNGLSRPNE